MVHKMAVVSTNGGSLPEELIAEILVRLPVKSLLRLKSVSNPWLSLISSPSFIDSHLRHAITKSDDNLILKQEDSVSLIQLNSDPIPAVNLVLPYSEGEFSFVPDMFFVGSSNGIVCVSLSTCLSYFSRFVNPNIIYLWNPATKNSKLIPPYTLRTHITSVFHGFGFDSVANDFKVVRVVIVDKSPEYIAEVYSANSNVWRVLESSPTIFPFGYCDVCVKGVLCNVGCENVIITFNLNTEVFNCDIKKPTGRCSSTYSTITEFKDSVAVVDYSYDKESYSEITLWRLDDACLSGGIEGSWTLIYKFDVAFAVDSIGLCFNSGDILLYTGGRSGSYGVWSLYNLDKKECKSVQVPRHTAPIFKYTESLVSIKGSKQVRRNAHAYDN